MGLVSGIWLAVLGILGAATLIVSKRPDAKEAIDKLVPYQGWIGAVSAFWGAWGVISAVLTLSWLSYGLYGIILWATLTASAVLQLALGLLLGVGIMKTFIKNPEANKRMDVTVAKLTPYQTKFGLAAIALGIWCVVSTFLFRLG